MPTWLENLYPIAILLAFITLVVSRLPKVDLGHSNAFVKRRFLNWFPLGLTYALLYFGRYNLAEAKNILGDSFTKADFGHVKMIGSWVYGVSFLINGPLTDMLGGRRTILLAAGGAALANIAMGIVVMQHPGHAELVSTLSLLYGVNMYFQSFGAVSIVKVNAHWFHVRERGMIGGVFGILISLGLYFAYDWSPMISRAFPAAPQLLFFIPAATLFTFFVIDFFLVRDNPSDVGFQDLETGDAKWAVEENKNPQGIAAIVVDALERTLVVGRQMLTHPVILSIALIEFCSGFLRGGLMDVYKFHTGQTGMHDFVSAHWGIAQAIAGITGGMVAGVLSDRLFQSRRGPISAILYGVVVVGSALAIMFLGKAPLAILAALMMMAIIGVHGMLSGTASMDFGGKKNAGIAVGLIDGFVYLGVGLQAWSIKYVTPGEGPEAANPDNWLMWPVSMLIVSAIGFALATRLWNAKPSSGASAGH